MPETRRAQNMPLYDLAVDPDFDRVDEAENAAVDWVVRGHAFEGMTELTLPKGEN